MSNEEFFLTFMCEEFEDIKNKEPLFEDSMKVYFFRHYWPDGTSSLYKIRFNSIGGFIDFKEVEKPEYAYYD